MEQSLEDSYARFGPFVLRRCRALLRTDDAAQDAMHEVLFGRFPVSSRDIAVLHLLDGLTLEETAAEVGLSVSGEAQAAAWSRWCRAIPASCPWRSGWSTGA